MSVCSNILEHSAMNNMRYFGKHNRRYRRGGDVLDWLSDEQAAHFTSLNLVERIDTDAQDAIAAAAHVPAASRDARQPRARGRNDGGQVRDQQNVLV
jgi:hypothetical protein